MLVLLGNMRFGTAEFLPIPYVNTLCDVFKFHYFSLWLFVATCYLCFMHHFGFMNVVHEFRCNFECQIDDF
jgi:hypothetical protein